MKILKIDHEKNGSATVILKGLELEKIVEALEDTLKYHTYDNTFKNLHKELKTIRDIVRFGEINFLEKREQSWEY